MIEFFGRHLYLLFSQMLTKQYKVICSAWMSPNFALICFSRFYVIVYYKNGLLDLSGPRSVLLYGSRSSKSGPRFSFCDDVNSISAKLRQVNWFTFLCELINYKTGSLSLQKIQFCVELSCSCWEQFNLYNQDHLMKKNMFCWLLNKSTQKFTIFYKKTDEWYIESQRVTTNDNEWYKEWQRMTTSVTTSDNE